MALSAAIDVCTSEFATPNPVEATRAIVNIRASVAAWHRPGGPFGVDEMAQRYCRLALAAVETVVSA